MVAVAAGLRRRGADRLVWVGSSMSCTVALAVAAEITLPVAGVVAVSSPEEFQGADAAAALRLTVPVLLIAAKDDPPYVPP
jgi:pimeloyl-ACP methyl ester carboxylesterase